MLDQTIAIYCFYNEVLKSLNVIDDSQTEIVFISFLGEFPQLFYNTESND